MGLQIGDRLFEWDENKNRKNYYDIKYSINENRWIT